MRENSSFLGRFIEELGASGYLEIWKEYADGELELVHSDHNTIVSGMGVGLALLFGGTGSDTINNFQIKYFQLGEDAWTTYGLSTFTLQDELSRAQYDTSSLAIHTLSQIKDGSLETEDMVLISQEMIRRVAVNSVQYTLTLDTGTANEVTLNEIGLLMKNPTGYADADRPILVAYKTFNNITKKEEFSLIFKWTLSF